MAPERRTFHVQDGKDSVSTEIQGERASLVKGTTQEKARRWDGMLGVWRLLKTQDGLLFL